MKIFIYLLLFLAILGGVGFGFFSMSMPHIEQTMTKVNIDPKEAFESPARAAPLAQPAAASSLPAPAMP